MNDEFIKTHIFDERSWPVENDGKNYYINEENTRKIISFLEGGMTSSKHIVYDARMMNHSHPMSIIFIISAITTLSCIL